MSNFKSKEITIAIVSEGTDPERIYFESCFKLWFETLKDKYDGKLLINNPAIIQENWRNIDTLKQTANNIKDDYNAVFLCYDIDDINDIDDAQNNSMALVSNRQFEYWLQLHIDKEKTPILVQQKSYYEKTDNDDKSCLVFVHTDANGEKKYSIRKKYLKNKMSCINLEDIDFACNEEKSRQQTNNIDKNYSFSTMYRFMDFLDNQIV